MMAAGGARVCRRASRHGVTQRATRHVTHRAAPQERRLLVFVISVVAGWLGFTGVASTTRSIARWLLFIALAIFVIVLVFGVWLGTLVF